MRGTKNRLNRSYREPPEAEKVAPCPVNSPASSSLKALKRGH